MQVDTLGAHTYHNIIGIYFRDTLFSRNAVECLETKFSRILYFAGYITRENIYQYNLWYKDARRNRPGCPGA